jgi:hypothetical protein
MLLYLVASCRTRRLTKGSSSVLRIITAFTTLWRRIRYEVLSFKYPQYIDADLGLVQAHRQEFDIFRRNLVTNDSG